MSQQHTESTSNANRPDVAFAATQQNAFNDLLPHLEEAGCIKEYAPVGDGTHLLQQDLSLLPLVEITRPRPHTLVRKVTVVGVHVLRYVSRNSNFFMRRQHRQNFQHTRLTRIDQNMNFGSAFNYDQENVDWFSNNHQPGIARLGLTHFQQDHSSQHLMLEDSPEDNSLLGWFNWKLYLGMICLIVAQALLKLSIREFYNAS
ncbi:hypothetical protein ACLKA6_007368 [Drosophila palustris]